MHQVLHFSPETCSERDARLNEAIDAAMSMASKDRTGGVLVTRHSPTHFTVTITAEVPYGQTQELDET